MRPPSAAIFQPCGSASGSWFRPRRSIRCSPASSGKITMKKRLPGEGGGAEGDQEIKSTDGSNPDQATAQPQQLDLKQLLQGLETPPQSPTAGRQKVGSQVIENVEPIDTEKAPDKAFRYRLQWHQVNE